jgi:hypothetical protein
MASIFVKNAKTCHVLCFIFDWWGSLGNFQAQNDFVKNKTTFGRQWKSVFIHEPMESVVLGRKHREQCRISTYSVTVNTVKLCPASHRGYINNWKIKLFQNEETEIQSHLITHRLHVWMGKWPFSRAVDGKRKMENLATVISRPHSARL